MKDTSYNMCERNSLGRMWQHKEDKDFKRTEIDIFLWVKKL